MNNTQIDIYAENPTVSLEYEIAVMQAAVSGQTVQYRDCRFSRAWAKTPFPAWDWSTTCYRIDPACKPQPAPVPKIAERHNPDRVTEEQLGIKDGWRLLSRGEIYMRDRPDSAISIWHLSSGWSSGSHGAAMAFTYRTKKPVGFFLPKAKKRVPLTVKDFDGYPIFWLFHKEFFPTQVKLVTGIDVRRVATEGTQYSFDHLMVDNISWSHDRINWRPCHKEVDA